MDWVQATGKTVDEAKDAALDLLGVDMSDAEFEVIEEARTGLFGRLKNEARVRARIRPATPRPKAERRDRKRGSGRDKDPSKDSAQTDGAKESSPKAERGASAASRGGSNGSGGAKERAPRPPRTESDRAPRAPRASGDTRSTDERGGTSVTEDMSVDEQAEKAEAFLTTLLDRFGISGALERVAVDDDTREVNVSGEAVGILVGPRGRTLEALQDVVRTVVQRHAGPSDKRVRVDVAGYRHKRREALAAFAVSVAESVRESGVARALEPMSSPDRKVVHDALVEIDGVVTSSEGEDPRRRVVVSPDTAVALVESAEPVEPVETAEVVEAAEAAETVEATDD